MSEFYVVGTCLNEPEIKKTTSGLAYTRLIVEVTRPYKNTNGVAETDQLSITVWKNLAEECASRISKGAPIAIKGRLNANNYTKEDGITYRCELVGEKVALLSQVI